MLQIQMDLTPNNIENSVPLIAPIANKKAITVKIINFSFNNDNLYSTSKSIKNIFNYLKEEK